jgi:methyl-accepting chemotaxis protein
MKRTERNASTAISDGEPLAASPKNNGHCITGTEPAELVAILASLQTMRDGDFSVRLPGSWVGMAGKIADTFNEIVTANQQMAQELKRIGQVVGKEGRTRERIRFHESRGAWGEMEVSVNTLVEDLLRPTTEVTRAIAAVAQGNLTQTVAARCGRTPVGGRVPALRKHRQHDDSAARRFYRRSNACRSRSRNRRKAGRPGTSTRRRWNVERSHRLG